MYLDSRKPGRYSYKDLDVCFLYEPFYVGKGFGDEKFVQLRLALSSWSDGKNHHRFNRIRKMARLGFELVICEIGSAMIEQEALAYEIEVIKKIGRLGISTGSLLNYTDGGQGITGLDPKLLVARNAKISASHMGLKLGTKQSIECRQLMSKSQSNRYQERRDNFPDIPELQDDAALEMLTQAEPRPTSKKYMYSEERRAKMSVGALRRIAEGRGGVPHQSGSRNGMYGTCRSGMKSPTAKFFYILISPEGKQTFVNRGCLVQVCKELNVSSGSMADSAIACTKTGKSYIAEKGRNKGWSAIRFENLSDNPLRCNNGQLAAKLQQKIVEEGSTTIESAQA